jgi:hypothetical protein
LLSRLLNLVSRLIYDWRNIISHMRTLIALILWCMLFVLCWPIALVVLFLFPLFWLLLLPFRILGFTLELGFKLVGAILLFPFRVFR